MAPKTNPEVIAALTAANEAKTTARLAFEAAVQELADAQKAFEAKQVACQKALQDYQSHIIGGK